MKTALSLMLALVTTTGLTEPLAVPKPPGPGGSCPHGYLAFGSYCVPRQARAMPLPSRRTHMPMGMARERQLLPAQPAPADHTPVYISPGDRAGDALKIPALRR
jgi:hypothetical protein